MDNDSKKEKELEVAHKRQQFQMHKKGYEDIVKAISNVSINKEEVVNVNMEMSETNKILSEIVSKINEPICVTLIIK